MQTSELLTVIAVAIALSAYLSTVRHRLFDKKRFSYARALMIADVPLVLTVILLVVFVAARTLANQDWTCVMYFGLGTFAFALGALISFHAYEWGISLKWWK